jgi:hypothetical protein
MKQALIMIITILSAILIISCGTDKQAETMPETESAPQTVSAEAGSKATCPSCNMVMEKSEMITYVAESDTVYFCAEGCKKHYLAQQEKKSE